MIIPVKIPTAKTNSVSVITLNFLKTNAVVNRIKIVEKFRIFSLLKICALAASKNNEITNPKNTKVSIIIKQSTK